MEEISDKLLADRYYSETRKHRGTNKIIQKLQQNNRYKKIAKALFKAFKPILYAVGASKLNGRQSLEVIKKQY